MNHYSNKPNKVRDLSETCPVTRKFGFKSKKAARRWFNSRAGTPDFGCRQLYFCAHCEMWHGTSQPKRKLVVA